MISASSAGTGIESLLRGMSEQAGLQAAGAVLLQGVRETFEREGPGWAQLADATVAERERKGFGPAHPILKRTGQLEASFKADIGTRSLQIESEGPRAIVFARLRKGTANMPARDVKISRVFVKRAAAAYVRRALGGRA